MPEVLGSWLFHAAMNILWERKYLVSDSFYSAATHRLVTFQKSPKSHCCLSVSPFFTENRRGPALLKCPCARGEWVHLPNSWGTVSKLINALNKGSWLLAGPAHPSWHLWCWPALGGLSWQHAPGCLGICRQACFVECPVATAGRGPAFPKSTVILILKSSR